LSIYKIALHELGSVASELIELNSYVNLLKNKTIEKSRSV